MRIISRVNILVFAISLLTSCTSEKKSESMIKKELNSNWTYQEIDGTHSGKAVVPGTIHTDLLNNNQIEDPFYRTNERDQQWIDKKDWKYSSVFTVEDNFIEKENLVLHFDGLDTYADVYINDKLVLNADNMFRQWDVDIKKLATKGENKIDIYFHSPIKKGLEIHEKAEYTYPANNDQSENGGIGDKKVSIFTRKAGYHYGWDWGPRFVTSGVWKPITLKAWSEFKIENVFIKQEKVNAEIAKLVAEVSIDADSDEEVEVLVKNKGDNKVFASRKIKLVVGSNKASLEFEIDKPNLWWSNGLGEAFLYDFDVQVIGSNVNSTESVRTGLRDIKLVREKDEQGESFYFVLNGVKVFAKGANYIPNDSFVTRVTDEDYEKVTDDAVNANMNMLRVWGGGIYEYDKFYELCDEKGIMVWQDFMFACSMYPGDEAFLNSVKAEAKDNVINLRNHPSIALWCGNNEINTAWSYFSDGGWGWKELYTEDQKEELQKAYMDIFHKILPEAVEMYSNSTDYWPSSPQAGYDAPKHASYETTSGDMHYWGVWHGLHPFEDFDKYKSRFMSEYGFQSFPDFETVKKYTTPEDYDIESEVMASHQRSGIGNLRIKEYMSWDYNVPQDFEKFLYMSHVLQARGIKAAIEAHRRAMPYTMGTLYWQINDCWPVASWSSTDYYHKWKAVHYAAQHAYEKVIVSAFENNNKLEFYAISDLQEDKAAKLLVHAINFNGKELFTEEKDINVAKNTSSLIDALDLVELNSKLDKNNSVLVIEIVSGGKVIANNLYYLSKPKVQDLPKVKIEKSLVEKDGKYFLELTSDKLARDVYLNFKGKETSLSNNYFDMLPGKKYVVELSAKEESLEALEILCLNDIK